MFKGSTNNVPNEECSGGVVFGVKHTQIGNCISKWRKARDLLPKASHHASNLTFHLFLCAADAIINFYRYLPSSCLSTTQSYSVFLGCWNPQPGADSFLYYQPQEEGMHAFPKASTTFNICSDPKALDLPALPPYVTISVWLHKSAEPGSWIRMISSWIMVILLRDTTSLGWAIQSITKIRLPQP